MMLVVNNYNCIYLAIVEIHSVQMQCTCMCVCAVNGVIVKIIA